MNAGRRGRIDRQLEVWQRELVNLTRRNRLLHFRHTRASTLEIVSPSLDEVWNGLGGGWRFYIPPDLDENELVAPPEPTSDRASDELVTTKDTDTEVLRALRSLERKASQTFIDTGLNVLYLCFGMLRWTDPADGSKVDSPILLRPVSFDRQSIGDQFRLVLGDADPVLNPALQIKLESDFSITLPQDDELLLEPGELMREIEDATRGEAGWEVAERMVFGTFTFHREAMYRDLIDNAEKAIRNPLVQSLALGPDATDEHDLDFDPVPAEAMDDLGPAEQLVSVADADSTQRACILAARDGRTFVMDGPPGTGKSQTITNVIAELLGAGKTVLFVSEKAAALDVVRNRLARASLDEFVLELHSHKATRKEFANELGRALATRPAARADFTTQDSSDLVATRTKLNAYAIALNRVRQPLDRSLFDVIGRVTSLPQDPAVPRAEIEPDELSPPVLGELVAKAGELGRAWGPIERGDEFLWRSLRSPAQAASRMAEIEGRLRAASAALGVLDERYRRTRDELGLRWAPSISDVDRLDRLLATVESYTERDRVPVRWLTTPSPGHDKSEIERFRTVTVELAEAMKVATSITEGWDRVPRPTVAQIASRASGLRAVVPHVTTDDLDAHGLQELSRAIVRRQEIAERIVAATAVVVDAFGLDDSELESGPQRLAELAELAEMIGASERPEQEWLNPVIQRALDEAEREIRHHVTDYRATGAVAGETFKASVLDLDVAALKGRMATTSGLSKLGRTYRHDKQELRRHLLTGKLDKATLDRLDDAIAWRAAAARLDAVEERHRNALGSYYSDRNVVDLDRLGRARTNSRRALELAGTVPPNGLARQLALSGDPSAHALAAGTSLRTALDEWAQPSDGVMAASVELGSLTPREFAVWASIVHDDVEGVARALELVKATADVALSVDQAVRLGEQLESIDALRAQIDNNAVDWQRLVGAAYAGADTRFEEIATGLRWAGLVRDLFGSALDEAVADRLVALPAASHGLTEALVEAKKTWGSILDELNSDHAATLAEVYDVAIDDAQSLLEELRESVHDIEEWNRYVNATDHLRAAGLGTVLDALEDAVVDPAQVQPALERAVLSAWADSVIAGDPDLQPVASVERDALVERFQQLDAAQVRQAASRIINACSANRPATIAGASGIIRREAEKKRRHMPIRRLLDESREVALKLKPCFMMSPLTVSQFLPSDLVFDAVIFDEASQVRPSEAINCLYRGRQVIVAGDPKQLPPTSFFDLAGPDDDEYIEGEPEDFESVLDAFRSSGVVEMPLNWHYRSRHESLITFSNYQFYDGRLHTFPGPHNEAFDLGVELFKVDGVYRRGANRDNPVEAAKVVERILYHRRRHPHLTLGVVAFSAAQEEAIDAAIEANAHAHPELDELVNSDRLDGFFVKNLENVQGDERDIIIFSIGYGPDEAGKFTEQLGPLTKPGGERRLNVAVTRARRRVEVVSSVTAGDFPGTSRARGVRELQRYLAFAERGIGALNVEAGPSNLDVESPFEAEVLRVVKELGYEGVPQVGVAGFRIDIGVRHPDRPGDFLIGIECDGAAYHSSKVARDRDRLRQQVLEGLGWTVHRIWGPSWYRDQNRELKRLKAAIEEALTSGGRPHLLGRDESQGDVVVEVVEAGFDDTPPWAAEYEVASVRPRRAVADFTDPKNRSVIVDTIVDIVEWEGPIHEELLRRRTMDAFEIGRMGSLIRRSYMTARTAALRAKRIHETDVGFFDIEDRSSRVRVPCNPDEVREVAHVPPSEIRLALTEHVRDALRIETDELIQQCGRLLGWQRIGSEIQRSLEKQLANAVQQGDLHLDGTQVVLAGSVLRSARPVREPRPDRKQVPRPDRKQGIRTRRRRLAGPRQLPTTNSAPAPRVSAGVHLRIDVDSSDGRIVTACGARIREGQAETTYDPDQVTCERCRSSDDYFFIEAVLLDEQLGFELGDDEAPSFERSEPLQCLACGLRVDPATGACCC